MAQILPDAASEALDFNNIKRRAIASRSYRVKLAPSNGSSFSPTTNSVINLDLPSNLAGTYIDFTQCYLKFTLTPNAACNLDKCGAYSIFQRMQCVTSGQQIYDLNNYNVLMAALIDIDSSDTYKANIGKVLAGTNAAGSLGEYVPATGRTFALPFVLHPFAMQKRLVPLFSLDSIRFRLTLDTAINAFVGGQASYTVQDVELCCYFTELSPSAQSQIDAMTGGVYNILAPSYMNIVQSMTGNVGGTTVTATLGVAVSSLERILVIHRTTAAVDAAKQTLGARITNNLSSLQFFINSEAYPMRPLELGNAGAEILAEMLISDHALSDFGKGSHINSQLYVSGLVIGNQAVNTCTLVNATEALYSYLNIPATGNISNCWFQGVGDGTTLALAAAQGAVSRAGSFIAAVELESGVSAGKSDRIYSGISTMSSVVQYKGVYGANCVDATIDFFCHYTILLTLNMRAMGVWTVSV